MWVVVAVLFNAGDHVPVISLVEVVGRALKLAPEQIAATASKVGVTFGLTVTTVAALAADVQPFASVTCTVGEDVVETVIEAVVAPVLQRYDEPSLAVKTTLPPEQKVVVVAAVIVAVLLQILALKIGCIRL